VRAATGPDGRSRGLPDPFPEHLSSNSHHHGPAGAYRAIVRPELVADRADVSGSAGTPADNCTALTCREVRGRTVPGGRHRTTNQKVEVRQNPAISDGSWRTEAALSDSLIGPAADTEAEDGGVARPCASDRF
jgi:hypothetical protein